MLVNSLGFVAIVLLYIPNFYSLLLCRVLQGLCIGFHSATTNLIIKEIAPPELSGPMGSLSAINMSVGGTFIFALVYALRKFTGDSTCEEFWFVIYGFGLIPIVLQTIGVLLVFPFETPKYWLMQGNEEKAKEVIR